MATPAPDIKEFQKRYSLSNKDMAAVCQCSLPTVQKWRSGEVGVSGAAQQLMRLLDAVADGDPVELREWLARINRPVGQAARSGESAELAELESSMSRVVDRLELMLQNRRKERELAESEARYRSIVESQEEPVCRWLPDTTLTYVNAAYARLYGDSRESLIGRQWMDFVPEDKRAGLRILVSDLVRRGELETMQHETVARDGSIRIIQWRDIPVKNERGEVVELHSVGRDQTELLQLRAEHALTARYRELLLTLCGSAVAVFDDNGRVLEANERFREDIGGGETAKALGEILPQLQWPPLRRLLARLQPADVLRHRVKAGERLFLMTVRLLQRTSSGARYIAVIRPEEAPAKPELQARLAHEAVLEGGVQEGFLERRARRRVLGEMAALGRQVGVCRVYAFIIDEAAGLFDNVLEWCAPGVEPQIDELQRIQLEAYPWWIKRILGRQWIVVEDTSKMPRTARSERELLVAQGIRAVLAAPIVVAGKAVGFVGFDETHDTRIWHQQEKAALEAFTGRLADLLERYAPGDA